MDAATDNPIAPTALGPEEGEALWFFGALVTLKARATRRAAASR